MWTMVATSRRGLPFGSCRAGFRAPLNVPEYTLSLRPGGTSDALYSKRVSEGQSESHYDYCGTWNNQLNEFFRQILPLVEVVCIISLDVT